MSLLDRGIPQSFCDAYHITMFNFAVETIGTTSASVFERGPAGGSVGRRRRRNGIINRPADMVIANDDRDIDNHDGHYRLSGFCFGKCQIRS